MMKHVVNPVDNW